MSESVAGGTPEYVMIRFNLPAGSDGWPPADSEGLWAEPLGGDQYRIDNTPWFVRNLATDDVVRAVADPDGILWATDRVQWSGRMTIRVVPRRAGPLGGDRQAVLDAFKPYGVSGEGIEQYGMVALDISPDADLLAVKSLLGMGQEDGRWDYEEGCISEEWAQL